MSYADAMNEAEATLLVGEMKQLWPRVAREDVAAIAVASGLIGGCVLLGLEVGWWAGLGLFFGLLVVWGVLVLRGAAATPDQAAASEPA